MIMQEREEVIAELQRLTQKASNVHEEIETLLSTHRFSQGGELVQAKKAAHSLVSALLTVVDILKKAQESQN
jgi:hypothetical protein